MQQVLQIVLQQQAQGQSNDALDIDATLTEILNEPWTLSGTGPERATLVVPALAGTTAFQSRTSRTTPRVPMIAARTNNITVCRESRQAAISEVISAITHQQSALLALAANLHSRMDVEWQEPAAMTPASATAEPIAAAWTDVAQTQQLPWK